MDLNRRIVAGDSFTLQHSYCGYISGSSKAVQITVKLPRILSAPNMPVTLTAMSGAIRGITGYLGGTGNDTNILTLSTVDSVTVVSSNVQTSAVVITILFKNALSVTNNTPVTFSGSIGLSF